MIQIVNKWNADYSGLPGTSCHQTQPAEQGQPAAEECQTATAVDPPTCHGAAAGTRGGGWCSPSIQHCQTYNKMQDEVMSQ